MRARWSDPAFRANQRRLADARREKRSAELAARRATAEAAGLEAQGQALARRLAAPDLPDELKRTLEQQAEVIQARRHGHLEAARRRERVQKRLGGPQG